MCGFVYARARVINSSNYGIYCSLLYVITIVANFQDGAVKMQRHQIVV